MRSLRSPPPPPAGTPRPCAPRNLRSCRAKAAGPSTAAVPPIPPAPPAARRARRASPRGPRSALMVVSSAATAHSLLPQPCRAPRRCPCRSSRPAVSSRYACAATRSERATVRLSHACRPKSTARIEHIRSQRPPEERNRRDVAGQNAGQRVRVHGAAGASQRKVGKQEELHAAGQGRPTDPQRVLRIAQPRADPHVDQEARIDQRRRDRIAAAAADPSPPSTPAAKAKPASPANGRRQKDSAPRRARNSVLGQPRIKAPRTIRADRQGPGAAASVFFCMRFLLIIYFNYLSARPDAGLVRFPQSLGRARHVAGPPAPDEQRVAQPVQISDRLRRNALHARQRHARPAPRGGTPCGRCAAPHSAGCRPAARTSAAAAALRSCGPSPLPVAPLRRPVTRACLGCTSSGSVARIEPRLNSSCCTRSRMAASGAKPRRPRPPSR